ncbi:MAG: sulfite exporter TauE/SafE family protein [Acidobacteria bacterium]|nr:sulfite exporter TauE/SafE family protein [Acidobacteriota bacterium]
MDGTLPLTGFAVGMLIGLTGIGGGALMTPFLILVLGTRPVVAVGTDLVYGAVTKLVGAYLHWRQGTVDVRLALRLAAASVPAGVLAVAALRLFPDAARADDAVKQVLGLVLVAVALLLLARLGGALPIALPERWRRTCQGGGTYAAGALVGALVGFTSVGSGSLLVPFLVSVFPLAPAQIVGTDVFHAAMLVTATGAAHAGRGTVDWPLAAALLVGSVPGVAVGSWMTTRLPSQAVRAGLAVLLLVAGANLMGLLG